MRAALLLVAACGGGAMDATPDTASASVDVHGFDLVVSSKWVFVFPLFSSPQLTSRPGVPEVGACGYFDTDAIQSFPSALTAVTIDGVELQHEQPFPDMQTAAAYASWTSGVTATTTLHATDANRTIDVAIAAPPFIAATDLAMSSATSAAGDDDLTVTWTGTGADSFFVGTSGGFGLGGCRVDGATHQHVFVGQGDPTPDLFTAYVEAFAAPTITQTELGPVRVFYGEVVSASAH